VFEASLAQRLVDARTQWDWLVEPLPPIIPLLVLLVFLLHGSEALRTAVASLPLLLILGLIGLYSMIIYLMVGGKEKMKKKCPSARKGSPDCIDTCSRANMLTLQQLPRSLLPLYSEEHSSSDESDASLV